jgi:hypothetical protein
MSLYYYCTKGLFAYQVITKGFVLAQSMWWQTVNVLSTHPFLFNLTLCCNPDCPETNFGKLRNLQNETFLNIYNRRERLFKTEKTLIFLHEYCIAFTVL